MYLFPFACVHCRRSFKRPSIKGGERPCPHCGATAVQLDRKFKAPPREDQDGWQIVRRLIAAGCRFASAHVQEAGHPKVFVPVAYPTKPREVDDFIRRHSRSLPRRLVIHQSAST